MCLFNATFHKSTLLWHMSSDLGWNALCDRDDTPNFKGSSMELKRLPFGAVPVIEFEYESNRSISFKTAAINYFWTWKFFTLTNTFDHHFNNWLNRIQNSDTCQILTKQTRKNKQYSTDIARKWITIVIPVHRILNSAECNSITTPRYLSRFRAWMGEIKAPINKICHQASL